jgi:hypothetical protein
MNAAISINTLFEKPKNIQSRWASFENRTAARGSGGRENAGAKGHAFESIAPGETKTLLDFSGSGLINRIWLTVSDRSPQMLRSLRLEMFWDESETPAVSVPLGDFFGIGLGRRTAFECALFSDPEGRSFNAFVPMPFRRHAKITLTNDSDTHLSHLFYDIDFLMGMTHSDETLYLHAHFRRESPNKLGQEFQILPQVLGSGRFLGCNLGVIAGEGYENTWWGEGEVKIYLGNDADPTLCGTGTEDYIGTAWGQGSYAQITQGCPIADSAKNQWAFYRYHIDDPIYFDAGCRVTIQTIGGGPKEKILALQRKQIPLIPVTIDAGAGNLIQLLDQPQPIDLENQPDGWCNFWRCDDWSATAYFYLDSPNGALPPLDKNTAARTASL